MRNSQLMVWVLFIGISGSLVEGLGVNWGTFASHPLPPNTTVKLLQDNGIKKVKLFDADPLILSSLRKSGIEVIIAIQNNMLSAMNDYANAKDWVKNNVTRYVEDGVNITLVAVGNEPFLSFYNDSYTNITFPALKNIHAALNESALAKNVKVTIPLNADVYDSPKSNPVPSAGAFRTDISDLMTNIVRFLNDTGAPFMVNIYPFLSLYGSPNFPIDYAFFEGNATPIIDKDIHYTNVFDANFDTLVSALNKVGFGELPIIVGEVGWPTDGNVNANTVLAQRFYDGLLKRLAANTGTPLRPNSTIEVYMFSLYDEDAKSILPGDFERHWGIFRYDGQPKLMMDLAGTGEKTMPVAAKDFEYLPKRWCVLNPQAKDLSKLNENADYACAHADCTSLGNGSSCGDLGEQGTASYAFNSYYQNQNQIDGSCGFGGLAMITTKNASQGSCTFKVQIVPFVAANISSNSSTSVTNSSAPSGSPDPSNRLAPSRPMGGHSDSASSALLVPGSLLIFFGIFSILI